MVSTEREVYIVLTDGEADQLKLLCVIRYNCKMGCSTNHAFFSILIKLKTCIGYYGNSLVNIVLVQEKYCQWYLFYM